MKEQYNINSVHFSTTISFYQYLVILRSSIEDSLRMISEEESADEVCSLLQMISEHTSFIERTIRFHEKQEQ